MALATIRNSRTRTWKIVDVTKEVIRNYFEETTKEIGDVRPAEPTPPVQSPPNTCHTRPPSLTQLTPHDNLQFEPLEPPISLSPQQTQPLLLHPNVQADETLALSPEFFLSPQYSDSSIEDGIFVPGSQYAELQATLRRRIIDTARSTGPSRSGTPEFPNLRNAEAQGTNDEESRVLARLSAEQEFVLWSNYIEEVAPWLDKFDNARHFGLVLPTLAKHQSHIRFSCLALSARQMERKAQKSDNSCSLALYQHAIRLLSPNLYQR